MGLMDKGFKSLFPPSWTITGDFKALVEAIAVNLERIRLFFKGVETEKEPGTADEYLSEWYDQLGIKYDSSQTLANRQLRANQVYSSTGGQDPEYLNQQLQIAYPDVEIKAYTVTPEFMAGFGMAGLMMATDYPSWFPDPIPLMSRYLQ